jgi:two-component system, NarL family, invasion response regulator UvrY
MKKKIIIIDDEPLIPALMKDIIEEDQELELAQIATGKNEFLSLVSQNSFDAALIDISVGGREGGIELLQIMKNKAIGLPLIMLSAHDEFYYALKCLQAGAKGYINKKYICTDITTCIKEVLGGHLYVSGDKGEQILNQYRIMTCH